MLASHTATKKLLKSMNASATDLLSQLTSRSVNWLSGTADDAKPASEVQSQSIPTPDTAMIYREGGAAAIVRVLSQQITPVEERFQLRVLKVLDGPSQYTLPWTAGKTFEVWRRKAYTYYGGWRLDPIESISNSHFGITTPRARILPFTGE